MKDQIKKITKLPKDKLSSASGKKSAPLTPHVTYGISSPSTAATKKANSRNFSMTYINSPLRYLPVLVSPSLTPRSLSLILKVKFHIENGKNLMLKDFVIKHEDLKQKLLVPQSARYASPKRDPILQNGSEGVQV